MMAIFSSLRHSDTVCVTFVKQEQEPVPGEMETKNNSPSQCVVVLDPLDLVLQLLDSAQDVHVLLL